MSELRDVVSLFLLIGNIIVGGMSPARWMAALNWFAAGFGASILVGRLLS